MPSIELATTYTMEGYEVHARKFIDTFIKYWPKDTVLRCYEEPYLGVRTEPRIIEKPHQNAFRDQFKDDHLANGFRQGRYVWKYDAVKWSHRIFALAAAERESKADILINIDSDIVTFDKIPDEFFVELLGGADIAYLPRKTMYSECSLVLYRLTNPKVREFIQKHELIYTSGFIFKFHNGWTDCHAFDEMIDVYVKHGLIVRNINEGVPDSKHPFVNGPLGQYMDHMKGERKLEGKSRKRDLVVERKEAYWK